VRKYLPNLEMPKEMYLGTRGVVHISGYGNYEETNPANIDV